MPRAAVGDGNIRESVAARRSLGICSCENLVGRRLANFGVIRMSRRGNGRRFGGRLNDGAKRIQSGEKRRRRVEVELRIGRFNTEEEAVLTGPLKARHI